MKVVSKILICFCNSSIKKKISERDDGGYCIEASGSLYLQIASNEQILLKKKWPYKYFFIISVFSVGQYLYFFKNLS